MRNRNIQVIVRLNKSEADRLKKRVKKSGLSQEAYLRQLIEGLIPRECPPTDYYAFMRELRVIGHDFKEIAQKAKALQMIDVAHYEEALSEYRRLVRDITAAVILPEKH